jgi:trans-feruloyl-CoA hydratase/vanillin synthase
MAQETYETVEIQRGEGITWVILNRPDKRNAMNPTLNREMAQVLERLEGDDETHVLVLTGAGDSFSAGMDLKEYFREVEGKSFGAQRQLRFDAQLWQYHKLRMFPKPTIAMVNGWCFGGAFTPLVSCDIAIAAEDATFGLSEVN